MTLKYALTAASALIAAPLAAQETAAPASQPETAQPAPAEPVPAPPVAATPADLTEGATVRGVNGEAIGTIEQGDAEGATVTTGTHRLRLPLNNFQKDAEGLRIGATRAQFEAAAQAISPS